MLLYKNRILVTGGSGRFGQVFKSQANHFKYKFFFPSKKNLDILNYKSIEKTLRKINWKGGFFRRDIGWRVIKKNENN